MELTELLFWIFLSAVVSSIIGAIIGSTVNKGGSGFLLGVLLGPIGWIIVLLLPREETDNTQEESVARLERPGQNLDNDDYKMWLGKTYNIQRNELFEQFECDGKLFSTLQEALVFAHEKESKKENLRKEKEEAAKKNIEAQDNAVRYFIFFFLVFLSVGLSIGFFYSS